LWPATGKCQSTLIFFTEESIGARSRPCGTASPFASEHAPEFFPVSPLLTELLLSPDTRRRCIASFRRWFRSPIIFRLSSHAVFCYFDFMSDKELVVDLLKRLADRREVAGHRPGD
jgi:hypothetical protein